MNVEECHFKYINMHYAGLLHWAINYKHQIYELRWEDTVAGRGMQLGLAVVSDLTRTHFLILRA